MPFAIILPGPQNHFKFNEPTQAVHFIDVHAGLPATYSQRVFFTVPSWPRARVRTARSRPGTTFAALLTVPAFRGLLTFSG